MWRGPSPTPPHKGEGKTPLLSPPLPACGKSKKCRRRAIRWRRSSARDTMYRDGARVRDIAAATGMSVGALYYHLDGHALPGLSTPRLPRRREVEGHAALPMPSRGRQKLAARLFRAAERQARKARTLARLGLSAQGGPRARPSSAARADPHPARPFRAGGFFRPRRAKGARRQRRARAGAGGGGTRGAG